MSQQTRDFEIAGHGEDSQHLHSTRHSTQTIQPAMMPSFEPSLSTSGMRPPLSSAYAPSMADSLPNINFGFEDLRNRMAQFTAKFDAFIERGRKQVLEERNQFRINLGELQGMCRFECAERQCMR